MIYKKKDINSLKDLKNFIFKHQIKKFPYFDDFYNNPYTYIKARYYMYASVILVFSLLRTRITPNSVTITYALQGIVIGILLSIPNFYCNLTAIFIAFNKGILDWSDGHLARIKYKTTLTGHVLDEYGAAINNISFYIGLGFFAMHQTSYGFLAYIIPLVPFFNGEQFTTSASVSMINALPDILKTEENENKAKKISSHTSNNYLNEKRNLYPLWIRKFGSILDGRARSTDLMLLIILIDIFYDSTLSLYLFVIIVFGLMIKFILSLVFGVRRKWAEHFIHEVKHRSLSN